MVPLGRGLALVPVTDEVRAAVTGGTGAATLGFRWLPAEFEALLAHGSALGPVAYVEAEHFGGVGEERAAVWAAGALALGPLDAPTREAVPPGGRSGLPGPAAAGRAAATGAGRVRGRGAGPAPGHRGLDLVRHHALTVPAPIVLPPAAPERR